MGHLAGDRGIPVSRGAAAKIMSESDADERALKAFAREFRLKVRLDECGDPIIPGRRGQSQLYFASGELCLMVIDGPVAKPSRWQTLGGKLWLGTVNAGAY